MKTFTKEASNSFYKTVHLLFIALLISFSGFSQNVGINSTGTAPNADAGLDVDFPNKGLLIPRVSLLGTTNFAPLTAHVAGMIVYNTATVADVVPGFYYNDGTKWVTGLPAGSAIGNMLYWNGTAWVLVPVGSPGQYLQMSSSNIPAWGGAAFSVITTTAASAITGIGATSGGNITSDGGSPVLARGVCWKTSSGPTIADSKTSDGTGIGTFTSSLTGLLPVTTYYVRSYSMNSNAFTYGNEISFTTLPVLATLDVTTAATSITGTTAISGGNVTATGGAPILERGICFGTTINPTITANTKIIDPAPGIGSFVSNLTGLAGFTTYHVRAYATNSAGTAYGTDISFTTAKTSPTLTTAPVSAITGTGATSGGSATSGGGGYSYGDRGIAYSTVPNSPTPTFVTIGFITTFPTGPWVTNITGLMSNTTYYIRSYLNKYDPNATWGTNAWSTDFGNEISFTTTGPVAPVIASTTAATALSANTASSGGAITTDGGSPITAKGVCWSTSPAPVLGTGNFTVDGTGNTSFASSITGLTSNTLYYVRAYATNAVGTSYGPTDVTLTTWVQAPYTLGQILSYGRVGYVAPNGTGFIVSPEIPSQNGWGCNGVNVTGTSTALGTGQANTAAILACSAGTTTAASVASAYTGGGFNDWYLPSAGDWAQIAMNYYWYGLNGNKMYYTSSQYSTMYNYASAYFYTGSQAYLINLNRVPTTNDLSLMSGIIAIRSFSAAAVPTVTVTAAATAITPTTAASGGTVTSDGGMAITAEGVCWSTTAGPTVALSTKTNDGSAIGTFVSNITGLLPSTLYHVRAYATNGAGTGYGPEITFTTASVSVPILTTDPISNLLDISATSGGNITSDGGAAVTARGVCWSTSTAPTTANSVLADVPGTGTGPFVSNIAGLIAGTTYHIRAYATNSIGTSYGNEVIFITQNIPTLTTTAITNIGGASAVSGGNITNIGGSLITARGVCWSTTPTATIGIGNFTSDGTGIGSFVSNITGLTTGTLYYVRAYATNGIGTAYGNEVSFTAAGAVVPTLTTAVITSPTSTGGTSGGNITNNGGSAVTLRGVCWSTSPGATKGVGNFTSNGAGSGVFTSSITGLTAGVTYYIRSYATNIIGTGYGSNEITYMPVGTPILTTQPVAYDAVATPTTASSGGTISSDGGSAISASGVVWGTATAPTIATHTGGGITNDNTAVGPYFSTLTGIVSGTVYYVRAYATNTSGTAYGNEITFTASGTLPVMTTNAIPAGGKVGAIAVGSGTVGGEGSTPVTSYGLCWNTTSNPTIGANLGMTTNTMSLTGMLPYSFNDVISGLTIGTLYHVRAYATNSSGTSYGLDVSFTATAATLGQVIPFNIGSLGNGVVIHIDGTGLHGLIADQLPWYATDWGCPGTSVGATGTTLGTGSANTTSMLANCPTSNAASVVKADGPDFYLPSKAEFDFLWTNGALDPTLNANLGAVAGTPFWSSSEADSNNAWYFDPLLPAPGWVSGPKTSLYNVWAIRSF